ncbi:unnamed protein product [Toxocara canis]|uniref:Uncharacterized protein n=1 Tax=Toxocara canis TaxID=6265 RepID=A0A3P7F333_TOXCA|nr:unnamed protein product [Toxocara canis]
MTGPDDPMIQNYTFLMIQTAINLGTFSFLAGKVLSFSA